MKTTLFVHMAMTRIIRLAALLTCSAVWTAQDLSAAEQPKPVTDFREVVASTDIETYSRAALALRKWMIKNDPHYPKYHFTSPIGWFNDPHPMYYRSKYHIFYNADFFPKGRRFENICWGHVVSDDLVHWVDWPVALWPDTPYDRNGVYSGNLCIDREGAMCAIYTGNVRSHAEAYGMLARSTDGGLTWKKKMVMDDTERPNVDSPVHWDGFPWKEGDTWCQLVGGTTGGTNRQGAAFLWTSPDLIHWTFQKNIAPSIRLGRFWELPYLIPLGGKHVLLVGCRNPY